MHNLTGFQRDLLYILAGMDAPKGLAVKAELNTYYQTEVDLGRLYPNLDTLVKKGFIEKGTIDDRTNAYRITDRGRREILDREKWEAQYIDMPVSA